MTKLQKPWHDDQGQLLTGKALFEAKKKWKPMDWEGYLREAVDKPLREVPAGGAQELAQLSDRASEEYCDFLEVENRSFLTKKIEQSLTKLSAAEKEVLYALFWEGVSQRELAKSLNLHRLTVRTYQKRALEKVARHLIETSRDMSY